MGIERPDWGPAPDAPVAWNGPPATVPAERHADWSLVPEETPAAPVPATAPPQAVAKETSIPGMTEEDVLNLSLAHLGTSSDLTKEDAGDALSEEEQFRADLLETWQDTSAHLAISRVEEVSEAILAALPFGMWEDFESEVDWLPENVRLAMAVELANADGTNLQGRVNRIADQLSDTDFTAFDDWLKARDPEEIDAMRRVFEAGADE